VLALVEPIKNFHSQNQEIKRGDLINLVRHNGSKTARHYRQPLPEDNRGFRCTHILPTTKALLAEAAHSRCLQFLQIHTPSAATDGLPGSTNNFAGIPYLLADDCFV
jgi:hypothetical protein